MVRPPKLILIGYWARSATDDVWPRPEDLIDNEWDTHQRYLVADYLSRGFVSRSYMGNSPCRICGLDNGALELSDGMFVWPDGLSHYVRDHGIRLPIEFESHVFEYVSSLETTERDEVLWRSLRGRPR